MTRILFLEDDEEFGKLVFGALKDLGYDVTLCKDATAAQLALKDGTFDLLIADLFIKVGGEIVSDGGILLIGRIRGARASSPLARHRDIPILAISGGAKYPKQTSILQVALSVGASSTLAKPFDQDALLEEISSLLSNAQQSAGSGQG